MTATNAEKQKRLRALRQAISQGWRVNVEAADTMMIIDLALITLEQQALLQLSGATDEEIRSQATQLSSRCAGRRKPSGV